MKKRVLIPVVLLLAAGAGGWYGYHYIKTDNTASSETVYVTKISTLTGDNAGVTSRFAGVVEPQETIEVNIESNRKVTKVEVKTGQEVKKGELLFEYDLSSIQEELQEAKLALDRLKNEAMGLEDQIRTLEAEKKKANSSNQLSYTIEIETNKMNLKKNEYDQKSKEAEITKLENATGNTQVRSEIDGIIQKIDTSKINSDDGDSMEDDFDLSSSSDSGESSAFITILSTGAYRVKGLVNEQNASDIVPGSPVIIRSRVDESITWKGIMGNIDRDNGQASSDEMSFFDNSDSQTSSSRYPFYVEMTSSEGLMLGQHVYIENDEGQEDQKDGLWLGEYYIEDIDQENPYVWAVDENGKLEKREIILGSYDEALFQYEIVDGLTPEDSIAFPTGELEEGMLTEEGTVDQMMNYQLEEDSYEDSEDMEEWDDSEEFIDMEEWDDSEEFDDMEIIEDMEDMEGFEDSGEIELEDMDDWEVIEEADLEGDME